MKRGFTQSYTRYPELLEIKEAKVVIKLIEKGNWEGRASTTWKGSIKDLRKKIPTFTSLEFKIGDAVNVYKSLIVREPLGEVDLGGEVHLINDRRIPDPMNAQRMPIEAVSNDYQRGLYRGRRQGYKLVQHHQVLDDVLKTLEKFNSVPHKVKIASLDATLKISIYGARIEIQFSVPHFKRNHYTLKITCSNSVDRSLALTIYLSLLKHEKDIPFAGFHHMHTQELKDSAVSDFFSHELHRFLYTTWDTDPIPTDPDFETIIIDTLTKHEGAEVQRMLKKGPRSLLRFREILALLEVEGNKLGLKDKQRVRFAKLLDKLHKLVDKKEKEVSL